MEFFHFDGFLLLILYTKSLGSSFFFVAIFNFGKMRIIFEDNLKLLLRIHKQHVCPCLILASPSFLNDAYKPSIFTRLIH